MEKKMINRDNNVEYTQDEMIREDPPICRKEESRREGARKEGGGGGEGRRDTKKDYDEHESEEIGDEEYSRSASTETKSTLDQEREDDEVWDIIRVIPTAEEKIECRYDHCSEQAVATWASNKLPEDKWSLCEKCQLEEFGGWPEGVEPMERSDDTVVVAVKSTPVRNEDTSIKGNTKSPTKRKIDNAIKNTPNSPIVTGAPATRTAFTTPSRVNLPTNDDGIALQRAAKELVITLDEREQQLLEEKYEISGMVPLEKLLRNPIKCSDEACNLPACSIWTSISDPKKWYYCIDCQERDFDGWPPSNEFSYESLKPEHLEAIATMCSRKRKPVMPVITSKCVTPPPSISTPKDVATSFSQRVSGKAKANFQNISLAAVARHEKWQADAKKLGMNRIIVRKSEAKKVVFDALYDAFRPMNFNDIYTMLKKTVPPPVLKATLEDMSMDWRDDDFFQASDGEDGKGTTEKKSSIIKEAYTGSLLFKAGKNVASNLYYVDHTKIKEMSAEDRRELFNSVESTKVERERLVNVFKQMDVKRSQLLIEPTNDELEVLLGELEGQVAILAKKVNDARELIINESHKNKLKRRIQSMAGHYRKRKRLCCSFLSSLEEVSDGTISKKKCLAGDGQIALDSDESVNKAALAYAKSKKRFKTKKTSLADENFIGVALDSHRSIKRVYVDEE